MIEGEDVHIMRGIEYDDQSYTVAYRIPLY